MGARKRAPGEAEAHSPKVFCNSSDRGLLLASVFQKLASRAGSPNSCQWWKEVQSRSLRGGEGKEGWAPRPPSEEQPGKRLRALGRLNLGVKATWAQACPAETRGTQSRSHAILSSHSTVSEDRYVQ